MFFRLGYQNTFKINVEQFVDVKYEADRWYQVDILLDWESKKSAFFIDGLFHVLVPFYSLERDVAMKKAALDKGLDCEKSFVNTLSLYTLTPGVDSSFRELRVCEDLCPGPATIKLHEDLTVNLKDPFSVFFI